MAEVKSDNSIYNVSFFFFFFLLFPLFSPRVFATNLHLRIIPRVWCCLEYISSESASKSASIEYVECASVFELFAACASFCICLSALQNIVNE